MCGFKIIRCSRASCLCVEEFNWVSVSKTPSPPKWRAELCAYEVSFFVVPEEILYAFFSFLFLFILEKCLFDLCTINFWKDLVHDILLLKDSLSLLFQIWYFGPMSSGGSYKITVVCLSVHQQFGISIKNKLLLFSRFCIKVDIWNI